MVYGNNKICNSHEFAEVFLVVQCSKNGISIIPYNYVGVISSLAFKNNSKEVPIKSYRLALNKLDKRNDGRIDLELLTDSICNIVSLNGVFVDDKEEECVFVKFSQNYIESIYRKYTWETMRYMEDFINDFDNECIELYHKELPKQKRKIDKHLKSV